MYQWKFLKNKKHGYSPNLSSHKSQKLRVWERIGDTMATWGPRSLMVGMTSEVQEVTRSLHAQVQNVDLVKDARELR